MARYRLLHNLGTEDARKCDQLGSRIPAGKHAAGDQVELSDAAADHLVSRYPGLLQPIEEPVNRDRKIKAVPAPAPITAPDKQ